MDFNPLKRLTNDEQLPIGVVGLFLRRIKHFFTIDCRLEKHRAIEGLFHNRIFLSK